MLRLHRRPPRRSTTGRRLFVLEPCGRWRGRVTAYIVREHRNGRPLGEILDDRFVVEHASTAAITQLLQDPGLIRRLADDCLGPLSAASNGIAGAGDQRR
jgi:hypothetical protein